MRKLLFVVGVGRSGTSLLQSMIHSHPKVEFIPETQFIRKYLLNGKKIDLSNVKVRDGFIRTLEQDEKIARTGLDPREMVIGADSMLAVYHNILNAKVAKNLEYVGDKDPRLLDYSEYLSGLFPQSRVIHIIRDPRDVVFSRSKADWSKHWPFFMHAFMYKAQLERGRRLGKKSFGSNYREVYYEDLTSRPVETLEGVCSFINIAYTQQMVTDFGDSAKKLVDAKEMQWKKETLGPLLKKNTHKWLNEWSPYQIGLVQKICKSAFEHHPYEKISLKLSFSNRLKIQFYEFMSSLFSFAYPLRVKLLK